jgi:uncharacterized membrane protein
MSIFTRRHEDTAVTTDVEAEHEARYGASESDRTTDGARHVDESARMTDDQTETTVTTRAGGREAAHEEYGGMNTGADFFGWLVAVAVATLLTGVIGALVAGISETADISQSDAERDAGTIGIVAAAVLVVVVGIGYYAGGYVAGRMSRFDGARQGLGVWLIGLVVMVIAGVTGAVFGREYNVLDRVDLPQLPVSGDDASMGAVITGAALLVVSLLAALAGGKVGRNYHSKVDAAHLG